MSVTLTLRPGAPASIDASLICADRLATLGTAEIAHLDVWVGRQRAALGDIFDVEGERSADVTVVGELGQVDGLGTNMTGGTLTIDGPAGRDVGLAMTGGTIATTGDVGDGAAVAMAGGYLAIRGSAGDRLGGAAPGASRGMIGGEIIVRGDTGADAGARARRGLIVVGGNAGPRAAHAMIAGSLVVCGRAGPGTGLWSKRGSIVALGGVDIPATYGFACTYRPPHIAVLVRYLRRVRNFPIDAGYGTGLFTRWVGDLADVGKGEILQWTT